MPDDWFSQNGIRTVVSAPQAAAAPDPEGDWFAQNGIRMAPTQTPDTRADPRAKPPSAEDFTPRAGWPAKIGDVALGALKGVGATAAGIGETAVNAGVIPGVQPAAFDPAMRNPVFRAADDAMAPTNTAQTVGKVGEQVAETLLPIGAAGKAAVEAIPSAARAGAKFQEVMGAAKSIPIDVSAPGNVALRIQELADRGASMPMAVRKFITHVTDPAKPPMTYETARDFASNISKLSANEAQRLTPTVAREVAGMRVALNKAVADAAAKAGKGAEYAQAMSEYARAKHLTGILDDVIEGAKKTAPYATAAGAGYWLTKQIGSLLGGG